MLLRSSMCDRQRCCWGRACAIDNDVAEVVHVLGIVNVWSFLSSFIDWCHDIFESWIVVNQPLVVVCLFVRLFCLFVVVCCCKLALMTSGKVFFLVTCVCNFVTMFVLSFVFSNITGKQLQHQIFRIFRQCLWDHAIKVPCYYYYYYYYYYY